MFNSFGERELTWVFGAGAVLMVFAAVLLALSRRWLVGRVLGALGVLVVMVGLLVIHQQTVVEKPSENITVTRPRFPDALRYQIRLALFGLPLVAAGVMSGVYVMTRRWLRSTLPEVLGQGLRQIYEKNYDGALDTYNHAIAIDPERADAYYHRGCVQEALGRHDKALADFDKALQLDPRLLNACNRRGKLRIASGAIDDAMADFERALDILPNDVHAILNRGICLANKGRIGEAVLDFEKVLRLTNHIDIAEPARHYLRLYGVLPDGVFRAPSPNAPPGASPPPTPPPLDYVI